MIFLVVPMPGTIEVLCPCLLAKPTPTQLSPSRLFFGVFSLPSFRAGVAAWFLPYLSVLTGTDWYGV